eukprot:gene15557-32862_t
MTPSMAATFSTPVAAIRPRRDARRIRRWERVVAFAKQIRVGTARGFAVHIRISALGYEFGTAAERGCDRCGHRWPVGGLAAVSKTSGD